MEWELTVAIIGFLGSVIGIYSQTRSLKKSWEEQVKAQAERDTKTEMRLSAIEKKLDEHNRLNDKIGLISESLVEIRNDIKWIKGNK